MKKTILRIALFACAAAPFPLAAQEQARITANIYGFVRGDAAVDSRQNVSAFEGLFLLYPQDVVRDANGNDLNKLANGGFYSFNSRLGVNVGGLKLRQASVTGKLEADFAGFSGSFGANYSVLRIRLAYIKMDWERSALTAGQAWHPFFGPVTPDVISISVGAPFNPFNRSPQLRYDRQVGPVQLSAAAIWQFQFASQGPAGKSPVYQRNALLPEFYAGATFASGGFLAGAGVDYLTIKPRTQSTVDNNTYKVDESLGSFSAVAYAKFTSGLFSVGAKTIYGQNLASQTMLGGYGVRSTDALTGEREYTNFTNTTTWINATYGSKYKGGVFAGYSKNLGSDKALDPGAPLYVDGPRVDCLYRLVGTFSYNIPHFMLGAEYEMTTAAYGDGDMNLSSGRYPGSHNVTNHRIVGAISYIF